MAKVLFFNGEQLEFPIVNGSQLWQGATFTRNSLANAFVGTTLTPFAVDVPRFGALESGDDAGLVVEGSRTNLFLRSEEFDNASWTKNDTTVTANQTTAPDNTTTADKLNDTATTSAHILSQSVTVTSGTTYTGSFFFKQGEHKWVQLLFSTTSSTFAGDAWANFDIENGVVGNTGTDAVTPTITDAGNGWYRCSISRAAIASASSGVAIPALTGNVNTSVRARSYLGTGEGVFIWGGQFEVGSFASSYIPTTSAAVTRAASVPLIEDVNTKPWFNASEFTVIAEFEVPQFVTSQRILAFGTAGSLLNRIEILTTGTSARLFVEGGSGAVADFTAAGLVAGASNKIALRCKLDDYAMSVNGGAVGTDTSAIVPPVTALFLGMSTVSGNHLNGVIKSLTLIPRGLTNAQLQALSS